MGTLHKHNKGVMNVCRLCSSTSSLISIFDSRVKKPNDMKDVIQVTTGVNISPSDNISQMVCFSCVERTISMFKFRSCAIVNDLELKEKAMNQESKIDETVQSLLIQYPTIVLPPSITEVNVAPKVCINENEVRNWMKTYRKKKKLEKKKRRESRASKEQERIPTGNFTRKIILHINSKKGEVMSKEEIVSVEQTQSVGTEIESLPVQTCDENMNCHEDNAKNINPQSDNTESDGPTSTMKNKSKRKLCLSLNKSKTKKVKLNMDLNESDSSTSSSLNVHPCDICNDIFYNSKALGRHKTKHMKCTLCGRKFHSMEATKDHSENHCNISRIMENLPNICLTRCDEIEEIRARYSSVFNKILPSDTAQVEKDTEVSSTEDVKLEICYLPSRTVHDVVHISDDENSKSENEPEVTPSTSRSSDDCDKIEEEPVVIPTNRKVLEKKKASEREMIKIIGNNILDLNVAQDDVSLLRNILKRIDNNTKDSSMQTDCPDSSEITPILEKERLFEFGNTKQFLDFHKIPVNISYGDQYSAKYNFEYSKRAKKNSTWSEVKSVQKSEGKNHKISDNPQSKPANTVDDGVNQAPTSTTPESSSTVTTISNALPKLIIVTSQPMASSVLSSDVQPSTSTTSPIICSNTPNSSSDSLATQTSPSGSSCPNALLYKHLTNSNSTTEASSKAQNSANLTSLQNRTNLNNISSAISEPNGHSQLNSNNYTSNNIAVSSATSFNFVGPVITSNIKLTNANTPLNTGNVLYVQSMKTMNVQPNNSVRLATLSANNVQNVMIPNNASFVQANNNPIVTTNNSANRRYATLTFLTTAPEMNAIQRNPNSSLRQTPFNPVGVPVRTVVGARSNAYYQNNSINRPVATNQSLNEISLNITDNGVQQSINPISTIGNTSQSGPRPIFVLGRMSTTYTPVSTPAISESSNKSLIVQETDRVVSRPLSVQNSVPLPSFHQQHTLNRRCNEAHNSALYEFNENGAQTLQMPKPSSQLNENSNLAPLIRVRNIAELR